LSNYRKKPVVVEAEQWFKNGDHSEDNTEMFKYRDGVEFEGEGNIVRYYRTPNIDGKDKCKHCGKIMHVHGWIDTIEGGHIVCPGDWIIKGIKGELYPCKPDIFEKTYEKVEEVVGQTA